MGQVGSLILLSGVYVTSLILMTGLRPIHLVRQTVAAIRRGDCQFARVAFAAEPAPDRLEGPARDQPARTGETTALDREAVETERRARAGAGRRFHFTGRTSQSAETESCRYHRAADGIGRRRARNPLSRSCAGKRKPRVHFPVSPARRGTRKTTRCRAWICWMSTTSRVASRLIRLSWSKSSRR